MVIFPPTLLGNKAAYHVIEKRNTITFIGSETVLEQQIRTVFLLIRLQREFLNFAHIAFFLLRSLFGNIVIITFVYEPQDLLTKYNQLFHREHGRVRSSSLAGFTF